MSHVGYWIDLSGVQLDEANRKLWLQAFPYGKYRHPLYGKIDFTPERASQFASNVKNKVRGQELDIDYDHKEHSGKAAGWVQDAEVRDNGLWIEVEFTEDAHSAIQKGEYKYFSPEFVDSWKHPSTGATHNDVLFGGALTNRPFLKDMIPVNMSEISGEGGNEVDEFLEELRKALQLSEDATEEEILAAAASAAEGPEEEETEEESEDEESEGEEEEEGEVELSESIANDPTVKRLIRQNKKLMERVDDLATVAKLSEVKTQLAEWKNPSGTWGLPPAVEEDLQKVMLSEGSTRVKAVIDKLLEVGLVELGERAGDRKLPRRLGNSESIIKQFSDKVAQVVKDSGDKLSFTEAALELSNQEPDLYEAYTHAVREGEGEVAN